MGIVVVQVSGQTCDEVLGRGEIAAFQEAPSQGAEPQFDLIEPRAVLGREVQDVFMRRVCQKGASLRAGAQVALVARQPIQACQEFANVQTPMRVQIIENPMEALVVGELRRDLGQMSGEIHAGACDAQIPDDLARGDDKRGDQAARTVTDVFVLAFFRFAGLDQNRGMLALQDLHACLFVATDDQFAVLVQDGSLHIELADILRLGVEVRIVAVEPVDAVVGFQVGGLQDTPDGGACHSFVGVLVDQDGGEIIETPLTGNTIMRGRFAGGQRHDFQLFVGGKSSVADRAAEHLAGQQGPAADNAFARESRCCDCNRIRWRPVNSTAAPELPSGGSTGTERPKLAGWNGLGSAPASDCGLRGPRQ